MEHKTAFGLHRPSGKHGLVNEVRPKKRQLNFLEQPFEIDVGRFIDDQAQGTAFTMLADVNDTLGKGFIPHPGHGNQEMIGQVKVLGLIRHAGILRRTSAVIRTALAAVASVSGLCDL